ncbi:hypothetical protein HMPREF9695_00897 [Afipia broomeae ATCC 49717]|uniref:Uncharacterized protein n=1 Tax=Afipia broomeae ATCC 49717 TaxID=883078 RepID=K8PQL1_9BRAD|nr:hypothetical protein HMPREF9695_00897 [Afipia broomeae ATCC 49717]
MHLDAPAGELFRNDAGCAMFLETNFGMGMKVAADGNEFVSIAFDQLNIGHAALSRFVW